MIARLRRGERVHALPLQIRRKDGALRWVAYSGQEWDDAGGLDAAALTARVSPTSPMLGRFLGASIATGFEVETTLDPAHQPFLHDHALEGLPLLPGVMAIEAFAELGRALAPELHLHAVEDVLFDKPFKYYRNEAASYRLRAQASPDGTGLAVTVQLLSLIASAGGDPARPPCARKAG